MRVAFGIDEHTPLTEPLTDAVCAPTSSPVVTR
jgi:hypothetical protein